MNETVRKSPSERRKNAFYAVALAAYIALNVFFLLHHENWRDEAQAWLLSRDLSIPELIRQMSYEGHPCLWHLLLMPLAKLGALYISMNVLSLAIMAAAAALFLWKSPLPLPLKLLALFGGAFVYFYPVISRSYCLIPLFAFLMAAFYADRREKPLRYGLAIALMVQTHIIMLGFAAAASLVWLGEAVCGYRRDRNRRALLLQGGGLTLPLLSFLFLLLQILNVQESSAYKADMHALLDIFPQTMQFLRRFPGPLGVILAVLFAGGGILLLIYLLRRRAFGVLKPLLVVALGLTFQVVMHFAVYPSDKTRKLTCIFMLLWFAWVAWPQLPAVWLRRLLGIAVAAVLAVTYILFPMAFKDVKSLYSDAQNCAAFIRENLPADAVFLETQEAYCSALLPYLPKEYTFYSPYDGEPISYVTWSGAHYAQMELGDYESVCDWARKLDPECKQIYLIYTQANSPLEKALSENLSAHLTEEMQLYCTSFDEGVPMKESYAIYAIPIDGESAGNA